ncbi:MAG: NrdH-redoxin [Verrucomicrobiales bacterium]|jgi:monothiol glutaredoxin|nr:NrdH-redoxin [Verrucomicrobiales bacterium]|tara:strand:+ start:64078 stop:64344 length:267 start_codon:yes stop_codon:yes gene_type:complete
MSSENQLIVYIKPGCPWCVDAVAYLRKEGFPFEEVDVISDPEQYRYMQKISGQTCAPTLTCGDLLLADFDVDEMIEFFDEHNITTPGK